MKIRLTLFLLALACLLPPLSAAVTGPLKAKDVKPIMEEMFGYHVEFKELNPLLIRRTFKLYIEQFDKEKIYLLYDEVEPFVALEADSIEEIIKHYQQDDFSDYEKLNQTIRGAILRARKIRREFERELILNSSNVEVGGGETYLQFASSIDELRDRIRKQLIRFLFSEKKADQPKGWNPERRQKIFTYWERRFDRLENPYLVKDSKGEHYFVVHLLKAFAKSLDAHTAFFTPDEAHEMRTSLEKEFEGVGVVLKESVDGVYVTDLIKGGPAERSGKIKVGDYLVSINGKSMVSVPYDEVLTHMKGNGKKEISLGFKRLRLEKEELLQVDLRREKIVMEGERLQWSAIPYADGIIGKLVLPSFYESGEDSSCEKDIREALRELKKKGKLLGLVLDMRENSGGFLNQAVKVAGLFVTSGVIVISKYSQGEVQYLRDIDGRVYYTGPLLVLTSKASASAAEIVAQALQDYGTALVVGDERTYGKGTIQYQTVTDDTATAYFKVTVGRYYTVSGKSTQIEGVKADIVIPTEYATYNIGERFLEYPLSGDQVPPAYNDPLVDIDRKTKEWFQRHYLPNVQKKEQFWLQVLNILRGNSRYRLSHDNNFLTFLHALDPVKYPLGKNELKKGNWGFDDLQMGESVQILRDMILLHFDSGAVLN